MSSLKDTDRMLDSDRHLGYLGRDSCHLGSGSENFCEAAVTHSDRCANLIVAADLMRTASLQEQRCAASNAQRGEEKSIRLLIATPHSEPSELHVPWRLSARTPIYQYWCLVSAIYEPSVPCVLHFLRSSSCKWEENQFPAPTGCKTKPREACLWNVKCRKVAESNPRWAEQNVKVDPEINRRSPTEKKASNRINTGLCSWACDPVPLRCFHILP